MVGIHQEKSGDFPEVSSENSQTNGHNSQEMVGIHQEKSGDFPDVSSENSQTNGHNSQEMVGIHQEAVGIHHEMVGIYQEKIWRFSAGILLPYSNVFSMFSFRNRAVLLELGKHTISICII